jgi:hypothetical protein
MQQHRKWLCSYPAVSKWMRRYRLPQLLDQNGGMVKISRFLPDFVAEGVRQDLLNTPGAKWVDTSASDDYAHNNIRWDPHCMHCPQGVAPASETALVLTASSSFILPMQPCLQEYEGSQ